MRCVRCSENAICKCSVCGKPICAEHIKLRPICNTCFTKSAEKYIVERALLLRDQKKIKELVRLFWGEQEQLTFDKVFRLAELPAFVAKVGKEVAGFVSFAAMQNDLIIVALGILPEYQGFGIGSSLISKVEGEARKLGSKRILVSTSNDDLPALEFYQSLDFQIYEVKPNVIAEKHGGVMRGIGNLPIRDELRLRKSVH
jgi:ribosomal protein S18 acetylase RimI-like enzyme